MVTEKELPIFAWPKGKAHRWAITGTKTPVLTYGGEWPHHDEDPGLLYFPLERPEICEEFAAIGHLALTVGRSSAASYEPEYESEDASRYVFVGQPDGELARAGNAEVDKLVQKRLIQFVREYGPPRYLSEEESQPRRFDELWSVGIPVGQFLMDAALLHRTMALAADIDASVRSCDFDPVELRRRMTYLAYHVSMEMDRTKLIIAVDVNDPDEPRLHATSTCTDLTGAMWLQLYEAVTRGGAWRNCTGCGRLFNPRREKQRYHSAVCRNRANVRRHAARRINLESEA